LIARDLSRPLRLAEFARACGLSKGHFSAAFRNTFGRPPHQWLLLQRLERAKLLIATTNHALSVIAIEIGFADQSHLTRIFSRHIGLSPAAWRRFQRCEPDAATSQARLCVSETRAAVRKDVAVRQTR